MSMGKGPKVRVCTQHEDQPAAARHCSVLSHAPAAGIMCAAAATLEVVWARLPGGIGMPCPDRPQHMQQCVARRATAAGGKRFADKARRLRPRVCALPSGVPQLLEMQIAPLNARGVLASFLNIDVGRASETTRLPFRVDRALLIGCRRGGRRRRSRPAGGRRRGSRR